MKNTQMAETAARYGMTARAFECLLERLGWMTEGVITDYVTERNYVTKNRELTEIGDSFLKGYFAGRGEYPG